MYRNTVDLNAVFRTNHNIFYTVDDTRLYQMIRTSVHLNLYVRRSYHQLVCFYQILWAQIGFGAKLLVKLLFKAFNMLFRDSMRL